MGLAGPEGCSWKGDRRWLEDGQRMEEGESLGLFHPKTVEQGN